MATSPISPFSPGSSVGPLSPPTNWESAFKGKRRSLEPLTLPTPRETTPVQTTEQKTDALFHTRAATPSGAKRKLSRALQAAKKIEPTTARPRAQSLTRLGTQGAKFLAQFGVKVHPNAGRVVRQDSEVRRFLTEFDSPRSLFRTTTSAYKPDVGIPQ